MSVRFSFSWGGQSGVIELDEECFDAEHLPSQVYRDIVTEQKAVEYIVWNMLTNDIPLSCIDGWADLPDYAARFIEQPRAPRVTAIVRLSS